MIRKCCSVPGCDRPEAGSITLNDVRLRFCRRRDHIDEIVERVMGEPRVVRSAMEKVFKGVVERHRKGKVA